MTKRTTIYYDGREYVVARTIEDVREDVDAILNSGSAGWVTSHHGRGKLRPADILINP